MCAKASEKAGMRAAAAAMHDSDGRDSLASCLIVRHDQGDTSEAAAKRSG